MKEKFTEFMDELVCPHCFTRGDCSYEWFSGDPSVGELETVATCGECGNDFTAIQHIEVSYTSLKFKKT